MSNNARKKERHRLKRMRKQSQLRRAKSLGPYQRISQSGGLLGCYANTDWRQRGQAVVFVLRQAPGGGLAMANFLIDLWCAGLKDAWGRFDLLREEFDQAVKTMSQRMDDTIGPVSLEEAGQIVAGGLRFAVQNGFRLPPHYERWTSFLGELGNWKEADLTYFGVDGKLRWVGPMWDLRNRLIGCTAEEFMARPDVDCITEVGDDFVIDDEEEDDQQEQEQEEEDQEAGQVDEDVLAMMREQLGQLTQKGADAVRRWCFSQGLKPAEHLEDAVGAMLASTFVATVGLEEDPADPEVLDRHPEVDESAQRTPQNVLQDVPIDDLADVNAALDQVRRFVQQFKSPEDMLQAWGFRQDE